MPDNPYYLDTEMLDKFSLFLDVCKKYNIKVIVGLITGWMSGRLFVPPALYGKNVISSLTAQYFEQLFIKGFIERFIDREEIYAWDLGNEVENVADGVEPDAFYFWCASIANAIRASDPTRPVVSGFGTGGLVSGLANAIEVGEYCDVNTVHPYDFVRMKDPVHTMRNVLNPAYRVRIKEDITGVPTFIQECGAIGYLSCSYETEAAFYRAAVLSSIAEGCHGFMWWCAFDQGSHSFAPYNWNNIGSQYGFFKEDRTEKPIAAENRYVKELLSALPDGLPKHVRDVTVLLTRECDKDGKVYRASYLLAKQAGLDARFAYALDPIPDSDLYILPCPSGNKSITKVRWNELLEKVRKGARLMITLSAGMLREIPETFGVRIDYRYDRPNRSELVLGDGLRLPVDSEFVYGIEPTTARVIGRDGAGKPVLFENDYGAGKTFLCTLPLERHAAERAGTFFEADAPAYYKVYERFAHGVRPKKISRIDSRFICRTEHVVNENERYIFAINYSTEEERVPLALSEGWHVEAVFGTGLSDGTLVLRGNDGILLRATRA